jgi:hypothetical protein
MFGAIYLFSTSFIGMNKKWIKQEKAEVTAFEVLNGTIILLSGGIILLHLKYFVNRYTITPSSD